MSAVLLAGTPKKFGWVNDAVRPGRAWAGRASPTVLAPTGGL